MTAVSIEQLADIVGDLGITCELRPCRDKSNPATALISIHHHCPVKNLKQVYAADAQCVERVTTTKPGCFYCGQDVEVVDVVPL